MSKRIDLKSQIFEDILVLEFYKNENSHAVWKCLCMRCNSLMYITYCNLVNNNTRSCQSCGNKRVSYMQECEIVEEYTTKNKKITAISRNLRIGRGVVYRVLKEHGVFRKKIS